MSETKKTNKIPQWLLFTIGGVALIAALGLLIWAVSLQQSMTALKAESTELAAQLTVEVMVEEEMAEQATEAPEPTSEPTTPPPTATPEPTTPPEPTQNVMTGDSFSQISFEFVPDVYELNDQPHYLVPPLHILLPEGWTFLFSETGSLTIIAPNAAETRMYLQMKDINTGAIFDLNDIGHFWYMSTGDLAWYPPNYIEVPFDLIPADYEISVHINDQDYYSQSFTLEEPLQARILQAAPMYRTYQDIIDKQRYRSFDSEQETMPMLGYTIMDDGRMFIRVWRKYDEEFYWINGEYVMHPELAIAYNTLEDLQDESGNWIIPEIKMP